MVSLDPDTEQDSEGIGAALDSRTEQGERQRRERPCRTHGLDFWRSRTAQPTSEVRERGDFKYAKKLLPLNNPRSGIPMRKWISPGGIRYFQDLGSWFSPL